MTPKILFATLLSVSLITLRAHAANRYWVASSASNWNNVSNWSTSSGGSGGASVPGSADIAIFSSNRNGNCTLDMAPVVAGITVSGYTGTIDMAGYGFTSSGTADLTFSSGVLTNSVGTSAVLSLTTTGTAYFSGTAFGTSLTQAPAIQSVTADLFLRGSVFYGVSSFEKNGSGLDYAGTGGNTFNATTTIINSGSAVLSLGYTTRDIFNADVTFSNTGTSYIGVANNTSGNQFNGNIVVNNPNAGGGVTFDDYSGTSSTLASGKTISVGTSFTGGNLSLQRFTQLGTAAQTLTLTGSATLNLGPSSTFNGNVTFKSPAVSLQGATYNGTTNYIEKTGSGGNYSGTGGNVFYGTSTLVNSGSGQLITGYSSADTFNGDVRFTNSGSSSISIGDHASGNAFNGNILVNSTNGGGIQFDGATGASSTLASGKTITVESSFTTGTLGLSQFTQTGSTAQNITLTGTGVLAIGPSATFNGALTASAPKITMQQSTFNGAVTMTNTSTSGNSDNYGGNTFNAAASFTNTGTTWWTFANSAGDKFYGTTTFAQTSTGSIRPAYNYTNNFYGNIIVNSSTAVKFGTGGGLVQLVGTSAQTITSASSIPVVQTLIINNSSGITLNNTLTVGINAYFYGGIVSTGSTNYLNFASGSGANSASNSSYVDGPVAKTGSTSFTFPVGNGGFYAPISITAGSGGSASDVYTAQYFYANPSAAGYNNTLHDATISSLSSHEYWNLARTNGSSYVSVTLSWDAARSGTVSSLGQLTVGRWNGSLWKDQGNGGTTGNSSAGTIVTSAAINTFGPFTLATTSTMNVLPVSWGTITANWGQYANKTAASIAWTTERENGNAYFDIERRAGDTAAAVWTKIGRVYSVGDSQTANSYDFWDQHPVDPGTAYYRLKQVDLDGNASYSKTVSLTAAGGLGSVRLWPNPVRAVVNLSVSGLNGSRVHVQIVDAVGRVAHEESLVINGEPALLTISTEALPPGSYFVLFSAGQGRPRLDAAFIKLR